MLEEQMLTGQDRRKGIPIQERSVRIGDFITVNAYHMNLIALKKRFAEGHYQVHETAHFLLFTRDEAPSTILVHWFAPDTVDADLGTFLMQELKPLEIVTDAQSFGSTFAGIIGSLFPHDGQRALRLYTTNTLRRYRTLLAVREPLPCSNANMDTFAALYQRICQMPLGESFLDAGCLFGFLTLLVAEYVPTLQRIVGADLQNDNFPLMRTLAEEQQLSQVQFVQADLRADDFCDIGQFDTIALLHVLEHLSEEDMYKVLTNLLNIMKQRLIIAVPYEQGEPEVAYGHLQLFSGPKLRTIGEWCLQQLQGHGRIWYEDFLGGLLLVERVPTKFYQTS